MSDRSVGSRTGRILTNPGSPLETFCLKLRAFSFSSPLVTPSMPPATVSHRKQPCNGCRSRKKRCDVRFCSTSPEQYAYWSLMDLSSSRLLSLRLAGPPSPQANTNGVISLPDHTAFLLKLSQMGYILRLHQPSSRRGKDLSHCFQRRI